MVLIAFWENDLKKRSVFKENKWLLSVCVCVGGGGGGNAFFSELTLFKKRPVVQEMLTVDHSYFHFCDKSENNYDLLFSLAD